MDQTTLTAALKPLRGSSPLKIMADPTDGRARLMTLMPKERRLLRAPFRYGRVLTWRLRICFATATPTARSPSSKEGRNCPQRAVEGGALVTRSSARDSLRGMS
jgi:DNA-binding MarR family transcriptional regulator